MKTLFPRKALTALMAAGLLATSPLALADNVRYGDPTFGAMFVDGFVVRPLGVGATVVGTAVWIVTLPFSALGGNVGEATEKLIVDPAEFTFTRPLGEL